VEAGELLLPALAALLAAPLPAALPDWLASFVLPGEDALRQEEGALTRDRETLAAREEELRRARAEFDLVRGLLAPRGTHGLAQAARGALERLGFTCSITADAPATFSAASPDGDLLVRVALSLFAPVGPEEHRALLLDLDRQRAEEKQELRGMLLAIAEPRLDPRRRGPQWAESVRRGCRDHGLVLASAYDLYRAIVHVLSGGDADEVRKSVLAADGEWRWKG
jgi:hypothetical protein